MRGVTQAFEAILLEVDQRVDRAELVRDENLAAWACDSDELDASSGRRT